MDDTDRTFTTRANPLELLPAASPTDQPCAERDFHAPHHWETWQVPVITADGSVPTLGSSMRYCLGAGDLVVGED